MDCPEGRHLGDEDLGGPLSERGLVDVPRARVEEVDLAKEGYSLGRFVFEGDQDGLKCQVAGSTCCCEQGVVTMKRLVLHNDLVDGVVLECENLMSLRGDGDGFFICIPDCPVLEVILLEKRVKTLEPRDDGSGHNFFSISERE